MGDGLWGETPLLTLLAGEFPHRWDEIKQRAEVQIVVTALGLPLGTMMFLKSAMKSGRSKDSKEE